VALLTYPRRHLIVPAPHRPYGGHPRPRPPPGSTPGALLQATDAAVRFKCVTKRPEWLASGPGRPAAAAAVAAAVAAAGRQRRLPRTRCCSSQVGGKGLQAQFSFSLLSALCKGLRVNVKLPSIPLLMLLPRLAAAACRRMRHDAGGA
jgi:hypothetical protein